MIRETSRGRWLRLGVMIDGGFWFHRYGSWNLETGSLRVGGTLTAVTSAAAAVRLWLAEAAAAAQGK